MRDINEKTAILLNLLEGSNDFITSADVALALGVSARSVMRYIGIINSIDENESFKIVAVPNKGLKIHIVDQDDFNHFKSTLTYIENYTEEYFDILYSLLFEGVTSLNKLTLKLNYSESSLNRIISSINRKLDSRGLKISRKNNEFTFTGNEVKIRNFMLYLFSDRSMSTSNLSFELRNMYDKLNHSLIKHPEDDLDEDYRNFVFIVLVRCLGNHFVEFNPIIQFLLSNKFKSNPDLTNIKTIFEQQFYVTIPFDEELFLNLYLLNQDHSNVNFNVLIDSLQPFIKKGLQIIDEKFGTAFINDNQLCDGLSYHISTSVIDYLLLSKSDNKMIDQIRLNYTNAYVYAQDFANYLYEEIGLEIDENDLGYIALHLATNLESLVNDARYPAIIVYSKNLTAAKLLKAMIKSKFNSIEIKGIVLVGTPDAKQDCLKFTCEDELELVEDIIKTSPFITNEDYEIINKRLLEISGYLPFTKLCLNDNFYSINHTTDKNALLEFLTKDLIHKGYMTVEESQGLINRESISSTEIAINIAFPHCVVSGKSFLAVAVLKQPIIWKNNVVKLVLLMGLNLNDTRSKDAIRYLFKNISEVDKVNSLLKVKDMSEFVKKVRE